MSDRQEYTTEQKAAVMAALLSGQSISQVAEQYRIPRGTVSRWSASIGIEAERTNKKAQIGELLIDYLAANLRTLRAQMEVFSDAEWLKKQGASELAVLHGVMADKSIRLLEALSDNDDDGTA